MIGTGHTEPKHVETEDAPSTAFTETEAVQNTRSIFEYVFDFFGTLDLDGKVIDLNGSIFETTNTDPSLLVGQRFFETVFWQSSETTAEILAKAIDGAAAGESQKVLLDFRLSADRKLAVEVSILPLMGEDLKEKVFICAQHTAGREEQVGHYKQETSELLFAAESADIGLMHWDLREDTIYSTPKCNEFFEVPAYDILTYESVLNIIHPEDRERVDAVISRSQLNGIGYQEEFRVVHSDGSYEWLVAEGKSLLDEFGDPHKMTSVIRKITEQKLADEEISRVYDREKKARDEAVEANRAKDFFLAFVSHELRSPLNAILGWSRILLTKPVDDETRRNALETIERSARFQTKLINDLVDSARVASGKIRLEFRPMNLYDVVVGSYQSQKPLAETQNIDFEIKSDSEEIVIFGDAGRLQQVFGNLISNAIKFTPEGGRIKIELESSEDIVSIYISDTGQGIPTDMLPNIFRQFSQADPDSERGQRGLGLGLSIVNILIGKHGGTVTAESDGPGQGSTFTVRLPLSASTNLTVNGPDQRAVMRARPLTGIKVLLVEDDIDSREVLQIFLEQSGARVESAESAAKAFAMLRSSIGDLPNVIISDLAMPDEDGYSLITRIRQLTRREGGSTPALALSAFTTNESKQLAFEAGFHKYSTKPFEPDLLITDIKELVTI
ncbi:MAG: ATP-binding protein [Pyrinomonadaceae bacterium]